ncbi:hypothetical protein [uncultured Halomonas sp.]|uniref:hypothetical protein n=1 Tax=uncultured Halomonas sp. TaxID=173971 RepID=UPI0026196165|nr:hypothetical protein [uncultured Halomonas sp.]
MAEVDKYQHAITHPDDWKFVRGLIHHAPDNVIPALLCAYLAIWRHAAMNEHKSHRKDNAGRKAANSRLRIDSQRMAIGHAETRQRYARLVRHGPKQTCATCQHCSLLGECNKGLPMRGDLCDEWRADFS